MMNPDTKSPRASEIARSEEVSSWDDSTVKLVAQESRCPRSGAIDRPRCMVISPAAIEIRKDLARNPSAPGRSVRRVVTDDQPDVKKFAGYWEKGEDGQALPYLDEVTYSLCPMPPMRSPLSELLPHIINQIAAKRCSRTGARRNWSLTNARPRLSRAFRSTTKTALRKLEVRQPWPLRIDADVIARICCWTPSRPVKAPSRQLRGPMIPSIALFTHDPAKGQELLQKAGLNLARQVFVSM